MLHTIKLVAVILLFFSCNTDKHARTKSGTSVTETASSQNATKDVSVKQLHVISGQVTQTNSYCGGARPSDEMLTQLATPRPYENKKFHVKKGVANKLETPILLSFTADEKGNFSFQLPDGTYSILQDEQAKPLNVDDYKVQYINVDEECLRAWWIKPYFLLEVKGTDIKNLNFQFHHPCFISGDAPCREYVGPIPP